MDPKATGPDATTRVPVSDLEQIAQMYERLARQFREETSVPTTDTEELLEYVRGKAKARLLEEFVTVLRGLYEPKPKP